MPNISKRQKALQGKVDGLKLYPIADALGIVKDCATAKFDESIDVSVQLGIDAKKSDQVVRGAVVLPNGTGKSKRWRCSRKVPGPKKPRRPAPTSSAWTTWPPRSRPARWTSTWSSPRPIRCAWSARSARSSARAGLMPNPKVGTVTADVATAVKNAKAGQVQFRVDKAGIVHSTQTPLLRCRQAQRQSAGADRRVGTRPSPRTAKACTCARWRCRRPWAWVCASTPLAGGDAELKWTLN